MKVIILFTLFFFCHGKYPVSNHETLETAPADVYGPPDEYSTLEKAEEAKPEVEPEPAIEDTNAPITPVQSASFNFLSDLIAQPLVTLGLHDNKNQNQEPVKVSLAENFAVSIPGLVPPVANIPPPILNPPVQVLPPAVAPVPVPVPIPVPVQPLPFPVQPIPVQSLPVQTKINAATDHQITQLAPQPNQVSVQSLQIPNHYQYQQFLSPFNYAPFFYRMNLLTPQSTFFNQFSPQLFTNAEIAPQLQNLPAEHQSTILNHSAENTISATNNAQFPAILEHSSTYGAQKTSSK